MPNVEIRCEAEPHFLMEQSDPAHHLYTFAYTITVRNAGAVAVQLIARHWIITDALGRTEEVKGLGVVGQQPLIKPGESYQYTSGTRLKAASGMMRGTFLFVSEQGERIDAEIPPFVLEASGVGAPARVLH